VAWSVTRPWPPTLTWPRPRPRPPTLTRPGPGPTVLTRPWSVTLARPVVTGPVVALTRPVVTLTRDRRPSSLGRGRTARQVADQLQRADRRGLEQAPRVGHQDRRPDVLARLAERPEVRARAGDMQLDPPDPQADPVLGGATHPRDHLAGRRRAQRHPPLGEVRLAARANRVAEDPRNFLGDPHHPFPTRTGRSDVRGDPALSPSADGATVTVAAEARPTIRFPRTVLNLGLEGPVTPMTNLGPAPIRVGDSGRNHPAPASRPQAAPFGAGPSRPAKAGRRSTCAVSLMNKVKRQADRQSPRGWDRPLCPLLLGRASPDSPSRTTRFGVEGRARSSFQGEVPGASHAHQSATLQVHQVTASKRDTTAGQSGSIDRR
jgi:hypothetical protein